MKIFGRMVVLSAVLAVVSACWLGCGGDSGTGPSKGTAPRITTSTLPSGTVGTSYSQTLKASGDAPITWSLESGALPAGLSLLRSGTISGTPTTAGTYNFSVDASNSAGSDVASFSITITGGSTIPVTPNTQSLDGVWEAGNGIRITINGTSGTFNSFGTSTLSPPYWADAVNKGIIKIGDQYWRNITSTGNLTWSGQELMVIYNTSNPNVAIGTSWESSNATTFTLSANGQTLTVNGSSTWTRSSNSLNGIWEAGNGIRITINGTSGTFNSFGTSTLSPPYWADAVNKGIIKIGDQYWRNITSTGNLTWSGQELMVIYNTSNPNVAIGTSWESSNVTTFTLSANGQTLTVNGSSTWTRKQ